MLSLLLISCRIVGEQATARSADFATALVFAQEYGIMAVSMEDRPFLPKTSVMFYGLTSECKAAFRKWEDKVLITGRKCPDVVTLSAAIDAIR